MLRIVEKFPFNTANQVYRKTSRLSLLIRQYAKKSPTDIPPEVGSRGSGAKYTIGFLALLGGGTIAYAKYDRDFRKLLTDNVPYTDETIRFVFQEDGSFFDKIFSSVDSIKSSVLSSDDFKPTTKLTIKPLAAKPGSDKSEDSYQAPPPVFKKPPEKQDEKASEIRIIKDKGTPEIETVSESLQEQASSKISSKTYTLIELESEIRDAAEAAINSYKDAAVALKAYADDVDIIVDSSFKNLDSSIWISLRKKSEAKQQAIDTAVESSTTALKDIKELKTLLNNADYEATEEMIAKAKRNLTRIEEDITKAKADFKKEQDKTSITDKYWQEVEKARSHFINELQILFPSVDITDRKLAISEADFDLFIYHAFSNILYYQKELKKLETVGAARLNAALDISKQNGESEIIIEEKIQVEIDSEKRKLFQEFQDKILATRLEVEKDAKQQLKRQIEAHNDNLQDALTAKEQEMQRHFNRILDERLARERNNYKAQLAQMIGKLKGMDMALRERADADEGAHQAQVLWSASQALHRSIKVGVPGVPPSEQVKPLQNEVNAVKNAAAENDELVQVIVAGIPKEAIIRGVFPEDALRERFLQVERVARRLALVPEEGGRLPLFLLSFLQSFLLIKAANPIPQAELNDEVVDFSQLDTYDVLQRARYYMDRGDFVQTLRYMNLLKGAPRAIARDWMNEARILLETQQAANTLMAHAAASGLIYL